MPEPGRRRWLAAWLLGLGAGAATGLIAGNASAQPASGSSRQGEVAGLPAAETGNWTLDTLRQDLAQFRREFFERDRSYSEAARAAAERRLQQLEASTELPSPARFGLALAELAALADNAHTAAFPTPRLQRCARVPIRLAPFGTGFHVLRTRAEHAGLLGARLVSIDDTAIGTLRDAAHRLAGGTAAWRDRTAPYLFECPEWLRALGLGRADDRARYRFETPEGRAIEATLAAEAPHPQRVHADTARLLLPGVNGPEFGWHGLLAAEHAPWWLLDAPQRLRWQHRADLDALVVQMRQTADSPNLRLADFFEAARSATQQLAPRHLVLDLRHNGGGDLTRARDAVERLPDLVPGRLFVLTSPWTFSAAITLAAALKQAAPERTTVVGEPVGDRLQFFAEGRSLTLRHSREVLRASLERHDYQDGCRAFPDCHAPVARRPIRVASLEPDLPAPLGLDDYRHGRDPALEAVAATLRASLPATRPA